MNTDTACLLAMFALGDTMVESSKSIEACRMYRHNTQLRDSAMKPIVAHF
jgi:hypothetical protein